MRAWAHAGPNEWEGKTGREVQTIATAAEPECSGRSGKRGGGEKRRAGWACSSRLRRREGEGRGGSVRLATYPRVRRLLLSLKAVEKGADREHTLTKALARGASDHLHGEDDLRDRRSATAQGDSDLERALLDGLRREREGDGSRKGVVVGVQVSCG